jgi:ABC-type polar amino acid transport system ATPase subunit
LLKSTGAKRAILLMTHDEEFARSVATRTLSISEGRITEAGKQPPKARRAKAAMEDDDPDE